MPPSNPVANTRMRVVKITDGGQSYVGGTVCFENIEGGNFAVPTQWQKGNASFFTGVPQMLAEFNIGNVYDVTFTRV